MSPPFQRQGIDKVPVAPWAWATLAGQTDPVEVVSFPIPAEGQCNIDANASVVVRIKVGEPGSLRQVRLEDIACFDKEDHEWDNRPKHIYDCGINAFVFMDE